jgi:hypothetical protein
MAISKVIKGGLALVLAAGLTGAMAGPAAADGAVEWDGVRGLDSITECEPGQDPFLHWILTPGGRSSATSATLWVDGVDYDGTKSGNGAFHFYTPSDADLSNVYADYVGTLGANALLTISSGCTGITYPS